MSWLIERDELLESLGRFFSSYIATPSHLHRDVHNEALIIGTGDPTWHSAAAHLHEPMFLALNMEDEPVPTTDGIVGPRDGILMASHRLRCRNLATIFEIHRRRDACHDLEGPGTGHLLEQVLVGTSLWPPK